MIPDAGTCNTWYVVAAVCKPHIMAFMVGSNVRSLNARVGYAVAATEDGGLASSESQENEDEKGTCGER